MTKEKVEIRFRWYKMMPDIPFRRQSMVSKLDELVPAIVQAGESGLTLAALRKKFVGTSKAKAAGREADLQEKLTSLVRDGRIQGPLKHSGKQHYFAAGHGPSIETASAVVIGLVLKSGIKLLSRPSLEKKVTGFNRPFFPDAIKHAVASRSVVELACGTSKYYLHRDVAEDYFGFEPAPAPEPAPREKPVAPPEPTPTFEDLLSAYRRIKTEQGGFSAVKIFDLMKMMQVSKDSLHRLILDETKAGRLSIHHTTSVELPREVTDAGIRVPGFAEPFVTVVVKTDQ